MNNIKNRALEVIQQSEIVAWPWSREERAEVHEWTSASYISSKDQVRFNGKIGGRLKKYQVSFIVPFNSLRKLVNARYTYMDNLIAALNDVSDEDLDTIIYNAVMEKETRRQARKAS